MVMYKYPISFEKTIIGEDCLRQFIIGWNKFYDGETKPLVFNPRLNCNAIAQCSLEEFWDSFNDRGYIVNRFDDGSLHISTIMQAVKLSLEVLDNSKNKNSSLENIGTEDRKTWYGAVKTVPKFKTIPLVTISGQINEVDRVGFWEVDPILKILEDHSYNIDKKEIERIKYIFYGSYEPPVHYDYCSSLRPMLGDGL